MDNYFLATKLRIPPQPDGVVHRDWRVAQLECDIARHKIAHVSAPAGYGKTTLLAQWARESRYHVAWLSLGDEDNDAERFLRYLLKAWERVHPGVTDTSVGVLLGSIRPARDAVLAAFINVLSEISDHTVFVLDDYHLIDEPSIHEALTFLLDNLPPTAHFVMSGRSDPPLPLARYRARHELLECRVQDLKFRPDETHEFLTRSMQLELSSSQIDSLHDQLEGWIAGLQLAALSLQRSGGSSQVLTISGRHRFIADYLAEDVFDRLPGDHQRFLLQTSILDRLTADLCSLVTARRDGQSMLEFLEGESLFIMPMDDDRKWYRYHRLFAEFLRAELPRRHPEEVAELHRRAARWYLERGLPEQAFDHAIQGDDVDAVIQIFERNLDSKLFAGEFAVVRGWVDRVPEEWISAYPDLGLAQAALLLFSGAFDLVHSRLNEIERMLSQKSDEDVRGRLARVTALRCFIACFQNDLDRAEIYADQALRDLPEDDLMFRPGVYGALGDTYRANGRWKEAQQSYLKLLDFTHSPAFLLQSVHLYGALADLSLMQGRLREASSYWDRALAVINDRSSWGYLPLTEAGWVYIRMGELLYEWNELERARLYLPDGLERAELGGDMRGMIAGYVNAARLKLTEGDITDASEFLDKARPLAEQSPFPYWVSRFERVQLELWLAQGNLRTAVNWADEKLEDTVFADRAESEIAHLASARALIIKGDAPAVDRALALLDHLLRSAELEGRTGISIEALALQSLAFQIRADQANALIALEQALSLAEPERYVRLFADLGLPMARLLQLARSRGVMPEYVDRILAAYGDPSASRLEHRQQLPEPLTGRELEIVQLLAAGLSNAEIAEELFISPETVKKHTTNIYGKLGVRRRTEAVSRARSLELIR
jgi:LuxR family transcriptional regulator, maltose regulon positive regulatory protein